MKVLPSWSHNTENKEINTENKEIKTKDHANHNFSLACQRQKGRIYKSTRRNNETYLVTTAHQVANKHICNTHINTQSSVLKSFQSEIIVFPNHLEQQDLPKYFFNTF